MKKLLVGLLLVASSALSFGAQRVPYEKLSFPGGYISYNDEKFTGEFERKDPRTGKINMVGSVKNGELHGTSYSYDENVKNAAMATPVPKGVGAVTTSVLAQHLVIAALKKRLY